MRGIFEACAHFGTDLSLLFRAERLGVEEADTIAVLLYSCSCVSAFSAIQGCATLGVCPFSRVSRIEVLCTVLEEIKLSVHS
jgi:hypothetical protein